MNTCSYVWQEMRGQKSGTWSQKLFKVSIYYSGLLVSLSYLPLKRANCLRKRISLFFSHSIALPFSSASFVTSPSHFYLEVIYQSFLSPKHPHPPNKFGSPTQPWHTFPMLYSPMSISHSGSCGKQSGCCVRCVSKTPSSSFHSWSYNDRRIPRTQHKSELKILAKNVFLFHAP